MIVSKRNFTDYTLLIMIIASSGVPYFSSAKLLVPVFVILLGVFVIRKIEFDLTIIIVLISLLIVTVVQTYIFDFYSLMTIMGVFIRIINAYFIVKILKEKFIPYFVNILYYIAIISLVFYISLMIIPQSYEILMKLIPFFETMNFTDSIHQTLVFYNMHLFYIMDFRNPGPFWEPAAYAGYLVLAFIFVVIMNRQDQKRKGIIILLTIMTTISTTAILALMAFLFFLMYERMRNNVYRLIGLSIVVAISYYSFTQFEFLGGKIERQISRATKGSDLYLEDTNTARFLSILRDAQDFKGHELFGRGANPITRYSVQVPEGQIRTVGITDILVRTGIFFFMLIMMLLYRSLRSVVNFFKSGDRALYFGAFSSVLILLMSETYFQFPIFWCLLFLHITYKNQKLSLDDQLI